MGTVARSYTTIFVIQAIIYQVLALNQQPITQYVLANIGPNGPQYGPNAPQYGSNTPQYGSNAPQYGPNAPQHGSIAPQYGSNGPQIIQKPNLPISLTNLASAVSTAPQNKPPLVPKPEVTTGPLDTNVLNNLAIALQLLIVSNIMNIPSQPEPVIPNLAKLSSPKYEVSSPMHSTLPSVLEILSKPNLFSYEAQSLAKPNLYLYEAPLVTKPSLYSYEAPSVPNANFLGSSGFSDPILGSIGAVKPNPRSSLTLMSPYDALGTSSFSDPLASFPTSYSKKDFQSPYASILATDGARDLFSIADLF